MLLCFHEREDEAIGFNQIMIKKYHKRDIVCIFRGNANHASYAIFTEISSASDTDRDIGIIYYIHHYLPSYDSV